MQSADVSALAAQVLWAAFFLAVAFGAVAQRTHFCTMGAVADIVNLGDWTRMRMWALALGVAVLGFNLAVAAGWLQADWSIYGGRRWLWASALTGGLLFGFGMVLASGCGSKNLVRLGAGNLKSLVVLMVLGLSSWATLKGVTAVLRVGTVDRLVLDLPAGQDLPSLLAYATGLAQPPLAAGLALLIGGGLIGWALARPEGRSPVALAGGLLIGLLLLALWAVSGGLGHVQEHPDTLEEAFIGTLTGRMEAFTFVAPMAHWLTWLVFFSDASQSLTLGVVCVVGVLVGAALSALVAGEFRLEGFRATDDLLRHLGGAALMGVGGVTAMGCSIGQGLSGASTLGLTSLVALPAIMAGAVAGLRFLNWQIERSI
jgi:uncharacterized membrane protein YedE/YeeE